MASAAGSDVFAVLALLVICLAVLLLLRYYLPLRSTPSYLLVPVFLAIALPASAIVILPIDLSSSTHVEDAPRRGIWPSERVVLVSWRITYWLTFVLTWLVLPLMGEYMDSGYRDTNSRLQYSLRSNGRYQLIMLGSATTGLVYMIFSYGFDFTAIKGLLMALAYVWGLILAIYLMGHGLVAVPRELIRNASTSGHLRRIQSRAVKVHDKLEDADIALEEIEVQITQLQSRKTGTARDFQDWIQDLADLVGSSPPRVTLQTPDLDTSSKIPAVITERYLADLTRRFNRARHQRSRYVDEWDRIVSTASKLQAILDSRTNKQLVLPDHNSSLLNRYAPITPYMRYHLHTHIYPALRLTLGAFLALFSLSIIYSELVRAISPRYSLVSLILIGPSSTSTTNPTFPLHTQFLAALTILYMSLTTLTSLSQVPIWNQRALVKSNTYPESATWYSGQIARLTVPLAYNFLTFLPRDLMVRTTFYHFLGRLINLTPLGSWFDTLFPCFILLPVCATFFNLYGRIKRVFGFGILEDEDDDSTSSGFASGGWREGRDLIARDLNGPTGGSTSIGLLGSSGQRSQSTSPAPGDRARSPRWAVSPSRGAQNLAPAAGASAGAPQRTRRARVNGVTLEPESEEEGFFALFGKRVKNTFDTVEAPRWMKGDNNGNNSNSGAGASSSAAGGGGGIEGMFANRPKWMGGQGDDNADGQGLFDRMFNTRNGGAGGGSRIVL